MIHVSLALFDFKTAARRCRRCGGRRIAVRRRVAIVARDRVDVCRIALGAEARSRCLLRAPSRPASASLAPTIWRSRA